MDLLTGGYTRNIICGSEGARTVGAYKGFRRIYLVAKRFMIFGAVFGAAFWLLQFYFTGSGSIVELIVLVMLPVVVGAFCWIITWIVEGFFTQSRPGEPHSSS
jgi:hypothetical protein